MKKSTLLSLATAGAIVATSAFTFAAWDTTTAESTGTVTFSNPVTVTTSTVSFTLTEETRVLNAMPIGATSDDAIQFEVSDNDQKTSGLKLDAVVKNQSNVDVTNQLDITFNDGTTDIKNGEIDVTTGTESTKYKVTVTPKSDATVSDLGGELSVAVTATLQPKIN